MPRQRKDESAGALVAGLSFLLVLTSTLWGQCGAGLGIANPNTSQIQQLFEQRNWAEVARLAGPPGVRSSDLNFEYGLALAHMQRWPEARAALMAGARECPREKRFDIELAGIAFEVKHYPEAAEWLRRGLKLDEKDDYANNFAGTVYLLLGNTNAALKYWNRVRKPYVASLDFDPQLHVQRLILDRAFAFSPAAELKEADFETTEARLNGLGIFPRYKLVLNARPDGDADGSGDEKFDVQFHAEERDGFGGGRVPALIATFSGTVYETVYPRYFNIGKSAANFESLFRWDSQKLRAWISVSAPLRDLPQRRWQLDVDTRDENWAIRQSFSGVAPILGSLKLDRESLKGTVTSFASGQLQWSTGAELSHRSYRNVVDGTALTPALVVPGYELKYLASVEGKAVNVPERRLSLLMAANLELARLWSSQAQAQTQIQGAPRVFAKLQGSALARWLPQAQGDTYEVEERVRAGRTLASAPFDELFLLGVERDTDLWLRGQIGTRDRKKGSSPLGSNYILANTDFSRRIVDNGLFGIRAGPLLDIARAGAPSTGLATGLSTGHWLADVGVEIKLTVMGTGVVLTYGRDLHTGSNAFYGTMAQ